MRRATLLLAAIALPVAACSGSPPEPSAETNLESNVAVEAAAAPEGNAALPEEAPLPPAARNPAAGAAGRDSYGWTAFRSAGGSGFPVLIYGAKGSDELVINFQCRQPRQVTALQMRDALGRTRGQPIALASGDQRLRLDVTLGPDSGDGSTPAAALVPTGDPLLQAFRSTGRLVVGSEGQALAADAVDAGERAAIDSFFAACGL